MQTTVVGRHMDVTDAIRTHAEQKINKLDKYRDQVIHCAFTLDRDRSGPDHFRAELLLSVRNHPELVAKSEGTDLYALIDDVVAKAGRQLHDFKEKTKLEKR